jgi:hypothetical protein
MTDEIDNGQDREDIGLAYAIRMASAQPLAAKGTGRCLWCDEPVPPGVRWCRVACRDSDQKAKGLL